MSVELNGNDYFRRRERDERELADKAASEAIRDLHLTMAERYRVLAEESEVRQRTDGDRTQPGPGEPPIAWEN
ncbi:MAG TPA: hypothetical protein VGD23_09845 [Sphingomicrobium sp.]